MSSTSTIAKTPTARIWIISPWCDLALLVATPLLIFPLIMLLARGAYTAEQIGLFAFAFASLGHHLPGMMRAYGDRELFQQYRWRFLLSPPLFLAATLTFFVWLQLHGLELVLLFWATWHIMMQTYGFMRIYDLKRGRCSAGDARWDFWACAAVFVSGVLFSDARVFGFTEVLWLAGLPEFGPGWLAAARWLVGGATVVVLSVFLVRSLAGRHLSAGVNWLKILLLCSTALLYWASGQVTVDLLIGVAIFEVFHAVQYYAIVWFYNRQRAERAGDDFGPLGFLFHGRWWGLPVYLCAIAAFGALGLWGRAGDPTAATKLATALFSASAMLHFYYDGFIWRVSQRKTRENLKLDSETDDASSAAEYRPRGHELKWAVLVGLVAVLSVLEIRGRSDTASEQSQRLAALYALTPNLPELQVRVSQFALLQGDVRAARQLAEKAVALRPRSYAAQIAFGNAATEMGDWPAAAAAFAETARLKPNDPETHYRLGLAQVQLEDYEAARQSLQRCLSSRPDHTQANYQLGNVFFLTDRMAEAAECYRKCTELSPDFADAFNNLGAALFETDQFAEAAAAYGRALELRPGNAAAHYNLGLVLMYQGQTDQARREVLRAYQLGQSPSIDVVEALGL